MNLRIFLLVGVLWLQLAASTAVADGLAGQARYLSIRGSSTILALMQELKKDLEQSLDVHCHIEGGGSVTGLEAVLDRQVDIAMVSRALTEQERKSLDHLTIAYDGVAVIVNRNNPVRNLSRQQIVDVFRGKVRSWKALDAAELPILVLAKDQHRSTREVFDAFFGLSDRVRASRYVGSNTEMIVLVGTSPRAIGYVSIGSLQTGLRYDVPVRALDMEGVAATVHNVATGAWPLRRELNLVWRRDKPPAKLAGFLRFMTSRKVRETVTANYFIPPPRDKHSGPP